MAIFSNIIKCYSICKSYVLCKIEIPLSDFYVLHMIFVCVGYLCYIYLKCFMSAIYKVVSWIIQRSVLFISNCCSVVTVANELYFVL
jgi:hypothetical protein